MKIHCIFSGIYFREKIFSREVIFAGRYFRVKIFSREQYLCQATLITSNLVTHSFGILWLVCGNDNTKNFNYIKQKY